MTSDELKTNTERNIWLAAVAALAVADGLPPPTGFVAAAAAIRAAAPLSSLSRAGAG